MAFVANLIPSFPKDFYERVQNFSAEKTNTKENSDEFILLIGRTAVAAAICIAVYKGSMVAAGFLAVISMPAACIAGGLIGLKYGLVALKAGLIANQITQTVVGAAALYSGWAVLQHYKDFKGLEVVIVKTKIVKDFYEYFAAKV